MKYLNEKIDRFCLRNPQFGIAGLMRYIVIGTVAVYFLQMFSSYESVSFLALDWSSLRRGELWRLVTFIFMPESTSPLWFALSMYFSYFIGEALETRWGKARFSLYFLSGWFLSVLSVLVGGLFFHYYALRLAGLNYISLAMFAAFAILYPDLQFLLFFVIPIKAKWLAIADGVFFAWIILQNLLAGNWAGAILPLLAVLNFFLFFAQDISDFAARQRGIRKHRYSRQTANFRRAAQEQKKPSTAHHKCSVCGRTDVSDPDLQFRYCSRCSGYYCYCQDHIFNHTHHTDEKE